MEKAFRARKDNPWQTGWGMRVSLTLLMITLAGVLQGCRYSGTLDAIPYVPNARASEGTKLPATIALVDGGRLDALQFVGGQNGYNFTLLVGPAIKEAFIKELEASFATVTTVAKPAENDKVDYYAFPLFAWVPQDPEVFTAIAAMKVVGRASGQVFAYQENTRASFQPSGKAAAAKLAEALTLFAAAPITEPMKNEAVGAVAQKAARDAIDVVMHRLGDDLRNDQKLELSAAMGPFQDALPEAKSRTHEQTPYDKFLDAVIVIKVGEAIGSGFFITTDGLIVTCAHVVGNAKTVAVKERDGRELSGNVINVDKERDLALVKVTGSSPFASLPLSVDVTQSVGREVIAIGAPDGMSWTLSKGIVGAVRSLRTAQVVQTDAAMLPGSSGGPLVDPSSGRAIGIASFTTQPGMHFAIAAEEVRKAFPSALSR